jgi:hypothetical protein
MLMIDLISEVLFQNGQKGVALLPSEEKDDTESRIPTEDLALASELPPDVEQLYLPPVNADYPEEVRELVTGLDGLPLYVFPPYGLLRKQEDGVRRALSDEYGLRSDLSTVTLLVVLSALPDGSRASFTLPAGFFTSRRSAEARERSIQFAHPELILQPRTHPFGDAVHQKFQVQTIFYILGQCEDDTPVTKFFSVPDSGNGYENIFSDFQKLTHQEGGETEHGFVVRERLDPEEAWTYGAHNPEIERELSEVEALGDVTPLGELFEISRGIKMARRDSTDDSFDEGSSVDSEIQVIGQKEIRRDGTIAVEDATRLSRVETLEAPEVASHREVTYLREGDLCVRQTIGDERGLVVGRVESDHSSVTVSSRVFLLRPKAETTLEETEVVLQYLQSERASRYLRSKHLGGIRGHGRLLKSSLQELPVPVADEELRDALRSLTETAEQFGQWKAEALEAAQSLFDRPTAKDGKMHVLSTGRRSRQRLKAAKRQDDLGYRVQTQFPHPVAYRWRTVAAAKPDLEGYLQVLECVEVLTCYLALVALTMAQEVEEEIGYLEQMRQRIAEGRGTNLGDWIAILREVRESRSFRQLSDDVPFYEVMHFMPENGDADRALTSLKVRRDNQAHGKGPRGDAVAPAFEEAKNDLISLFDATEFLSEYPLRYVDRTQADTIQNRLAYWYRDIMGDHPLVPVEKKTTAPTTLEAGSLYLVDRSESLHLLRPLLDRRRCPVCGSWSTFFLDTYLDGEDACILKSMEHPHTTKDGEIYEAFQKVGLLP